VTGAAFSAAELTRPSLVADLPGARAAGPRVKS
jgi:hypothetical protein